MRIQRGHFAVGDAHHLRAVFLGKAHALHRARGIPRKADAHQHVAAIDTGDLLEHVSGGVAHQRYPVENLVQIVVHELRQRRRGSQSHHIDAPCVQKAPDHIVKILLGQRLDGFTDVVRVVFEHGGQHIPLLDAGGNGEALLAGQALAYQAAQTLAQLRISLIAHGGGKTHHGALAYAAFAAQRPGRHKDRLVIVLGNVFGNTPVPLAQRPGALVQHADQFPGVLHGIKTFFPAGRFSRCPARPTHGCRGLRGCP